MLSARSGRASCRYRSSRVPVAAAVAIVQTVPQGPSRDVATPILRWPGGTSMDIGIYGLGRMGGNMVTRLLRGGHRVVAGNRSPGPVDEKKAEGAVGAYSIEEMAKQLRAPRVLRATG